MNGVWNKIRSYWRLLGPGLVTGAADDDPSGIATYSQTAVMFGYTQLWVALFSFPFMTVIQEMCGRIGLVTGDGLSGVIRRYYSRQILLGAISLLIVANTINIGADLGAMAASLQLLVPVPFFVLLVAITVVTILLEIFVPYPTYAKILKYLALSLFAYVISAFLVKQNWPLILHSTLLPHISLTKDYVLNIAAFLGTTISPYLFFWQADEEVEDEIVRGEMANIGEGTPNITGEDVSRMRADTIVGMFFSNFVTFFILVTVASTLGAAGIRHIATAADAASALRPVAGNFAFFLFTLGIIGTGLLAIPVLAGSAGYAVAEAMQWKMGLGKQFGQARGFYVVIGLATLVGVLVNMTSIAPMTMLYYSAMLNGVLAPPLMVLILLMANDSRVMGERVNGRVSNILGWTITLIMGVVGLGVIAALFI